MTDAELDAMIAELREPYKWPKPCIKAADAIAALREQVAKSRLTNLVEGRNIFQWRDLAIPNQKAEAENAALRQLLASISQRIVKALYDDPVERKGIATVIDAATLAGKEKP